MNLADIGRTIFVDDRDVRAMRSPLSIDPYIEPKKIAIKIGKPMIKNMPSQSRLMSCRSLAAMVSTVRISLAGSCR